MKKTISSLIWKGIGLVASLASSVAVHGQTADAVREVLGRHVENFSVQAQDARLVLEAIGSAYHFPVVVEADVQGSVSFEVHNATVETLFEAVCEPKGWSHEISPGGYLLIRRFVTRIYPVDYLQMSQTGTSSASINLSESAGSTGTVLASSLVTGSATTGSQTGAAQGVSATGSGGSSVLSVSQQNDADFWGRLESDLKAMVGEGESLVVNRFAGVVQLKGSLHTHQMMSAYLGRVLQRVGRQARISVKVVEVDLNNQSSMGIDWNLAAASFGKIAGSTITLGGASTATGTISQIGSLALNPQTFTGTIGAGGVQATLSALSEQGTVRIESKPEVSALNNQTAFVQVSEDQPFFSRTSTTTINAGGVSQAGTQPIVNTNYSESTVSFGNVLEITVQIADDLSTKLSISPAMTELKGTVTSPDGQETAPVTGTKRARTTVTVRNHETAIVGGFITETKGTDARSIPGLGSLPLIGAAFTTKANAISRTELVFLVTVNAEEPPAVAPFVSAEASPGATPTPEVDHHVGVERLGIDGGGA